MSGKPNGKKGEPRGGSSNFRQGADAAKSRPADSKLRSGVFIDPSLMPQPEDLVEEALAGIARMNIRDDDAGHDSDGDAKYAQQNNAVASKPQAALPITAFQEDIVWTVAKCTVSIIKGDTGSGKSTKSPQYILDTGMLAHSLAQEHSSSVSSPNKIIPVPPEIWGDARPCIYVTQPRRVAAVTLAHRVADERGETAGQTIGYRIGQEAAVGKSTQITFCTCGWLLQWLVHSSANDNSSVSSSSAESTSLSVRADIPSGHAGPSSSSSSAEAGVTHIIVDEVHERGIDTDLVCLLVKLATARGMRARVRAVEAASAAVSSGSLTAVQAAREAALIYARRTRLILMSATFDTSIFVEYFANVAASHAAELSAALRAAGSGKGSSGRAALEAACSFTTPLSKAMKPLPSPYNKQCAESAKCNEHIRRTLVEAMRADEPGTLYVGAKRYPVEIIYMEDAARLPMLTSPSPSSALSFAAGMSKQEFEGVGKVIDQFDKAATTWQKRKEMAKKGGPGAGAAGGGDPDAGGSVGDALILQEAGQTSVMRLAARLALAVSKPGTGDCILIFVSGMSDIDAMVAIFAELAPGKVAAPTAKLAVNEVMEDEADQVALQEAASHAQHQLAESVDSDEEEEEETSRSRNLQTVSGRRAGAGQGAAAEVLGLLSRGADAVADAGQRPGHGQGGGSNPAPDRSSVRLLPMHSLISFEDQMAAFDTSGTDKRTRIVIATNIAESSVTLPDVHTVIDLCRTKTVEYVPKLGTSMLRTTWSSQASAQQRAGRCGRLMPGTCYRMVTKPFLDKVMPPYELPEMLRLSLDTVVLKVKMLGVHMSEGTDGEGIQQLHGDSSDNERASSAKAVLAASIQPPEASNVDSALAKLAALGALESSEDSAEVTPFGKLLATFPGDLGLGKLVAYGAVMNCLADAIVMAACLAVQDIFLMPHAAMAASPAEFAATVSKVTRSRALFGRDATLASLQKLQMDTPPLSLSSRKGPAAVGGKMQDIYAGSGTQSWSEPIAVRNAYVAWRCVTNMKARGAWCAAYGIVARRMTTVHSMVREIGVRLANDCPGLAPTIHSLIGDRQPRGFSAAGAGRSGGMEEKEGAWPPPGLFTPDTHVLRTVLLAAQIGNLCVGTPNARKKAAQQLVEWKMDPRRALMCKISRAAPQWLRTMGMRGDPATLPPMKGAQAVPGAFPESLSTRKPYVGTLATALSEHAGLPRDRVSGLVCAAKVGLIGLEVDPDWAAEQHVLHDGKYSEEGLWGRGRDTEAAARAGTPFPARLSLPAVQLLGVHGQPASHASTLAAQPLAYAMPSSALLLLQMAGTSGQLTLPLPSSGSLPASGGADPLTGARPYVVGAGWKDDDNGRGKGKEDNRPIDASAPVTLTEVSSVYGVSWKTQAAASGATAFGSALKAGMTAKAGKKGKASTGGSKAFSARPAQNGLVRLLADMGAPGTAVASEPEDMSGKGGKKGGKGGRERDREEATAQAGASVPLLSVCSSLQLQEKQGAGVNAAMTGATVLWRDCTALALGLLLFGRGIEVQLTWTHMPAGMAAKGASKGDDGSIQAAAADAVVIGVVFDPNGTDKLALYPTFITLADLRRVNDIRMRISARLACTDLGFGVAQLGPGGQLGGSNSGVNSSSSIQAEIQAVLGLSTAPSALAGAPSSSTGGGKPSAEQVAHFAAGVRHTWTVTVTDFDATIIRAPVLSHPLPAPQPITAHGGRRTGGGPVDARRGGKERAVVPQPVQKLEEQADAFLLSPLRASDGDCTSLGASGPVRAPTQHAHTMPSQGTHTFYPDAKVQETKGRGKQGAGQAEPATVTRRYTPGQGVPAADAARAHANGCKVDSSVRITVGAGGERRIQVADDDEEDSDEYYSDEDDESDDTERRAGGGGWRGGRGGRGGASGRGGRGDSRGGGRGGAAGRAGDRGDKPKREGGGRGGGRGGKKTSSGVEKAIALNKVASKASREAQASEILEARRKAEEDAKKRRDHDLMHNSFAANQAKMEKEAAAKAKAAAAAPPPAPPQARPPGAAAGGGRPPTAAPAAAAKGPQPGRAAPPAVPAPQAKGR